MLRGRIEWNDDFSDTDFDRVFIIDGKRITIEGFGGMFEPFEGFNFVFKIKDPYIEIIKSVCSVTRRLAQASAPI